MNGKMIKEAKWNFSLKKNNHYYLINKLKLINY